MLYEFMTFNMRCNTPVDGKQAWPYRRQAVFDFIQEKKPLIIGTQEVTQDMKDDIEQALTHYQTIGVARTANDESNLILYDKNELICIESGTFWLSKTPQIPDSIDFDSACVRICTWATLSFKHQRNVMFRVFNTHLDHISEQAKVNGIRIIFEKIKSMNQILLLPTILMGDFNSTLNSTTIDWIKNKQNNQALPTLSAYDLLNKNERIATYHAYKGITTGDPIDYIYYSKQCEVEKAKIYKGTYQGRYLSDHYPFSLWIHMTDI